MEFIFSAKDSSGKTREGEVESINKDAAIQIIQQKGLIPISVEEKGQISPIIKEIKRIWEGISPREMVIFYRQLATLIESKVPIVQSLQALGDQSENRFLKIIIKEIEADIKDGKTLSESMAKHPLVFNSVAVSIINSGEISGNLQKSVSYIADNIEKNYQLASKIKSALYYPAFVIIVAFIVAFIVVTVILPRLTSIIKDMAIEVPWYTKFMMGLGDFMQSYWWAVLIAIFGIIGGFIYYFKSESGKRDWDELKIKAPFLGGFFKAIYISRFSDNFSALIDGGIPIVNALRETSRVIGNSVFEDIFLRSAEEVKRGGRISDVLDKSSEIPPVVAKIVRVGEETGKIGEVLKKNAEFYEREVDAMARNISVMIEPILILLLGAGVSILVFSVLLPIYNIAGQIK